MPNPSSRPKRRTFLAFQPPSLGEEETLYDEGLEDLDGIEPLVRDVHAHHLYIVRSERELAGATRDDYRDAIEAVRHVHASFTT